MRAKSLTGQTVFTALAVQLVCALVLCCAALLHEEHTRMRAFDTRLQGLSDSLLGAVQDAEDPDDNVAIDPMELRLPPEDVYAVYNQNGRLLGSSANAPPALIERRHDGFRDTHVYRKRYRVLQSEAMRIIDRAEFGGVGLRRPVTIIYAAPEDHIWHEIFEAAQFYLIAIAVATAAIVLLLPALLRRTLRPLAELASATARITPPSLEFQPPPSAIGLRELKPLTEVLGASIERIRESFAREHRFVSDAAHELKTAIAVARSSAQVLMLKHRSEEEYRAGLDRIVEDIQRMETLVAQMLQLARFSESGDERLPAINLGETAQCMAALLRPVAHHRHLKIEVDADPDAQVRLQQESAEVLLSNLLMNAMQHSAPASSVLVSVSRNGSGSVCLRVSDQGTGISPEALPHVFERFYREDQSRARNTGGTGLGLAISKSIVDAAKGKIEVESTVGVGTTMLVTFVSA